MAEDPGKLVDVDLHGDIPEPTLMVLLQRKQGQREELIKRCIATHTFFLELREYVLVFTPTCILKCYD